MVTSKALGLQIVSELSEFERCEPTDLEAGSKPGGLPHTINRVPQTIRIKRELT